MTVSSAEDGTVMKRPRDTKEYPGFDTSCVNLRDESKRVSNACKMFEARLTLF